MGCGFFFFFLFRGGVKRFSLNMTFHILPPQHPSSCAHILCDWKRSPLDKFLGP